MTTEACAPPPAALTSLLWGEARVLVVFNTPQVILMCKNTSHLEASA